MKAVLTVLMMLSSSSSARAMDQRWSRVLRHLVETNSGSDNHEGLEAARRIVRDEMTALGFQVTESTLEGGRKVLVIQVANAKPSVLLVGHLDTVFGKDSPFQHFREDATTVYGPGVLDMKGGVVLAMDVMASLDAKQRAGVRLVLNDDEELGSPTSAPELKRLAAGIPYGLVFEPGLDNGDYVTSQSGVHWIELRSKGKAAHAGSAHAEGVNACAELAADLVAISDLTDYAERLTVNVGIMRGGTKPNVVCEEAEARIDIRFVHQRDLDTTLAAIKKIISQTHVANKKTGEAAVTTLTEIIHIPSLPETLSPNLRAIARAVSEANGSKIEGRHVGYGSDANQLAPIGIELLVGLGPYGGGYHSDQEHMLKASYDARRRWISALIEAILRRGPATSL